ncbi:enkurin [Pygocentrus nattereri]|uniref:Enkurin domain-containing protein n=1 Tax=Pygocentrus nattereri TaxID=42514 RepID=A0A3B4DGA8_PYGNA|nr:enkurin [Pygocentrus nattereri]
MSHTALHPPERIYNLIPREEEKVQKPPRYISKFREQVKQEKQLYKTSNKTMGPAKVDMPSPDKYLLKHSKEPKRPEKKPFLCGGEGHPKKPPIPATTDYPPMGTHTKKNFVKTNAIENIMAVPRKPQPTYTDTRHGDKQLLENSGLLPKYTKKKDYGQTPEYLQLRREEVQREQEEYDNYVKERLKEGAMRQLPEGERQNILQGLKKNWDELHHQFQGLSVVTDTASKKFRKEHLEMKMKQLERDIDLMERYKIIYITNN